MTVQPFIHPDYHNNKERCGIDEDPCVICGKPVKRTGKVRRWLRVVDGGKRFASPDEEVEERGDMGCFLVGPGCWRRYRQELTAFTFK